MALKTNLISHWTLDESSDGSGAVTRNDSHGSNHLTDNNTTASATGKISNGADFERTNSERLSITDASQSGLDIGANSLSINAWINLESLPSTAADYFGIAAKYSSSPANRSYSFHIEDSNKLGCHISQTSNASTRRFSVTTGDAFVSGDLGTWFMVTAVFDLGANTIAIYKNGTSLTLTTNNAGTVTTLFDNSLPFTIGWGNQAGAQYMDGIIDEVSIWNKALTGSEITEIYNGGSGLAFSSWDTATPTFIPRIMFY